MMLHTRILMLHTFSCGFQVCIVKVAIMKISKNANLSMCGESRSTYVVLEPVAHGQKPLNLQYYECYELCVDWRLSCHVFQSRVAQLVTCFPSANRSGAARVGRRSLYTIDSLFNSLECVAAFYSP